MDAKTLKVLIGSMDISIFPDEEAIGKLNLLAGHEEHAQDIEFTYAACDKGKYEALGDKVLGYFLLKELYATMDSKQVAAAFSQYASNAAINYFMFQVLGKFKPKLADLFEIYIQCLNELHLSPALLIRVYVQVSKENIKLSSSMVDSLNRHLKNRKKETSIKLVPTNYKGAVLEFAASVGFAIECVNRATSTGYITEVKAHNFLGRDAVSEGVSTSVDDSEQLAFADMQEKLYAIMDSEDQ